jgi:hypothetical protein
MLEKEILMRTLKHVINQWMRDSPEPFLAQVVSHFLNIVLAPQPFLKQLESGDIKYSKASAAPIHTEEQVVAESEPEQSKAQKKKNKKKGGNKEEQKSGSKDVDGLDDVIFKHGGSEPVFIDELFSNKAISTQLHHIDEP